MGSHKAVPLFRSLAKFMVPGGFNMRQVSRARSTEISFASDNLGGVGGSSRREESSRAHYQIATRCERVSHYPRTQTAV